MKLLQLLLLLVFSGSALATEDIQTIAKEIGDDFVKFMRPAGPPDKRFVRRPVFAKAHGCVKAKFTVNPELRAEYRVGPFEKEWYPAWIRFANDGGFGSDERQGARGMSIKLVGVGGTKLLKGEEEAVTQDFVMQNHHVFFTDTAAIFRDFIKAAIDPDPEHKKHYDAAHPETERVLGEIDAKLLADPLDGQYWTPTPYKFGEKVIKYMAKPCKEVPNPPTKPMKGEHYLRENLRAHLGQREDACMEFYVQFQTKDDEIDLATVAWKGDWEKFATLNIPREQDIDSEERETLCERLSMTGWHTSELMRPVGSVNEARGIVYKRIADLRREKSGVPIAEPTELKLD